MKVHVLLLLLGAALAAATSEPVVELPPLPEGQKCLGNPESDRWRQDCNWCTCRNGVPGCTRRLCRQGKEELVRRCEGNPAWMEGCNTCHCEDGLTVCTSRQCDEESEAPKGGDEAVNAVCEDGSRWRDGCNWCLCQGGVSRCTKAACVDWNEEEAQQEGIVECHGASRWKKDCNWCQCVNGRGVCTLRACIPSERDPFHNLPENAMCVPGSRWLKGCNWCTCAETGIAGCTLRGCLPGYAPEGPTCEEGSVWRSDDCNLCRCINGVSACTKRLCRTAPQMPQVPEEPQCQGDPSTDRWRMDCNWCTCRDGVGACTRRFCPEGVKDPAPECEGNPSWMKDCNRCTCVNGRAVCTTKFCGPLPTRPAVQVHRAVLEPECRGDPETDRWTKDCNWCRCNNGVPGCTKRMCRQGEQNLPRCEGNPSWKDDCNHCHCNNGTAVCTTKFCGSLPTRPAVQVHRAVLEPECRGDPETDQWTKDCNWCRCNNGVPGCTKRLCRQGEQNLPRCEGNPSWKDDCNHCHCNNGTAVCTTKFCGGPLGPHSRRVQTSVVTKNPKPVCVDGSRWRVGCNWCTCHNGMAACTEKLCLDPSAGSDEPECEGNASWKSDCNWCSCGDGLALCTRMACIDPSEKLCREGSSWRDDCNTCRCSHGFVLCTKKACAKQGKEIECKGDSCVPGQLPELCHLPPVEGILQCTGFFMKWRFSVRDGKCQQIVYGGCGGTENLFDSEEQCKATCPSTTTSKTTTTIAQTRRTFAVSTAASQGSGRCHLPMVAGPCFGALPRYAYNTASDLCEEFLYGGCAGNGNNFETQEECRAACQQSQGSGDGCDRSQCAWSLWGHYLAKECVPQYAGDACCPTSFHCPSASEAGRNPDKCHYKGVSYNIGDPVPVKEPCSASCLCRASHDASAPPEITCANVECPDLFHPPTPGCRPLYRADQCCPYDHECVDPQAPPLEPRAALCTWQNQTYQQGSKMYFDDYPCQSCICGPGFTDPTGPGCFKIDCGLEFRYTSEYHRGCTPILFEQDGCCPIAWMCPGDSRIVPQQQQQQQQQQPGSADETSVCHLGEQRLAVGDVLGLTDCKIECRCITPPELTCIQYRSCELAQETAAQRECPAVQCGPGCHPVVESPGQCLTCSCSADIFSCPAQTCPSNCSPEIDLQTGCPTCKCQCPTELSCPTGCPSHTVLDEDTGCPRCQCQPGSTRVLDPELCPVHPGGKVPCPQDCAVVNTVDENGCKVCKCDENTFGPPVPLDPHFCPGEGQAPCPMDCGIIRRKDANGCEVCECDPNDTGNPFGPPYPPIPPPGHPLHPELCPGEGQAPCPMDCGIIRRKDANGCEVCECDPNDTGNPFGPPLPPQHRVRRSCFRKWEAPCPMDCGVVRRTDKNGCWLCECDPDNPGNPFLRPLLPALPARSAGCPSYLDQCPMDCAVIRYKDENGCEVCECDPTDPGNPFGLPLPQYPGFSD